MGVAKRQRKWFYKLRWWDR